MPLIPIDSIFVPEDSYLRVPPEVVMQRGREISAAADPHAAYDPLLLACDGRTLVDGRITLEALRLAKIDPVSVEIQGDADFSVAKHTRRVLSATPRSKLSQLHALLADYRIYVAAHPEAIPRNWQGHLGSLDDVAPTYFGPDPAKPWAKPTLWPPYAEFVEATGGKSARTIRRYLERARAIIPEVFAQCDRSPGCNLWACLEGVAQLSPEQQSGVVAEVVNGRCDLTHAVHRAAYAAATSAEAHHGLEDEHPIKATAGDFREVAKTIDDESVDLVLTDPPWQTATQHLIVPLAEIMMAKLRPGGTGLVILGHRWVPQMLNALLGAGLEYRWIATYEHPEYIASAHPEVVAEFHTTYPIIVVAKPGDPRPRPMVEDTFRERAGTVPNYPLRGPHHQQWKSVEALERMIFSFTKQGDLVYDPFSGGGSTSIASFRTGRLAVTSDANPANVINLIEWARECSWGQDVTAEGALRYEAEAGSATVKVEVDYWADVLEAE